METASLRDANSVFLMLHSVCIKFHPLLTSANCFIFLAYSFTLLIVFIYYMNKKDYSPVLDYTHIPKLSLQLTDG